MENRHTGAALSDEELGGAPLCCSAPRGLQPARPPHTALPCAQPGAAPWCPRGSRRQVMKRKVLRRRPDGGVEVSDESVGSLPQSAAVWALTHRMLQLSTAAEDSLSEGDMERSSSVLPPEPSRQSPRTAHHPPFLLRVTQSPPGSQCAATAGQPKSFIAPRSDAPGRSRLRSDRVAKYLEYKREWERFPAPGEEPRRDRRCARGQMLAPSGPPGRPPRGRVPNTYTVPTDKKRAALRWGVRWALANGLLPRAAPHER